MKILLKGQLDIDLTRLGYRPGQVIDADIRKDSKVAYFTTSASGIRQDCVVGMDNFEILETTRPALNPNFLEIECPPSSFEFKILEAAVNLGIDSHLQGFTKSNFGYRISDTIGLRAYFNFELSEVHILIRRLESFRPKYEGFVLDDLIDNIKIGCVPESLY